MEDARQAASFISQALILLSVVVTSLYNLSTGDGNKDTLWTTLLSASIGLVSPAPKWGKKRKPQTTDSNGNHGSGSDTSERFVNGLVPGQQDIRLPSTPTS